MIAPEQALERELLARENAWMDAWKRRDRAPAEDILDDDFVLVSSLSGESFSKA